MLRRSQLQQIVDTKRFVRRTKRAQLLLDVAAASRKEEGGLRTEEVLDERKEQKEQRDEAILILLHLEDAEANLQVAQHG